MDLIKALRSLSIETGSLACLGCGHEHNCGIHGCAIIRAASDKIAELNDFASSQSAKLLARVAELEGQLCTSPSETIYEQTLREYGVINIANLYECAEHREAAIRAQLSTSQQEKWAAVEFIRHLDREYSHYIADRGFEQWRGPQEAGEEQK